MDTQLHCVPKFLVNLVIQRLEEIKSELQIIYGQHHKKSNWGYGKYTAWTYFGFVLCLGI